MSMYPHSNSTPLDYGYAETGERTKLISQFFNQVYMYMAIALMWTAVVSAALAYTPALHFAMGRGTAVAAMIGLFLLAIGTQAAALRLGVAAGLALFMIYATLMGVFIAPIWVMYPQSLIGVAFLLTGGVFFVVSLVGMVTKMDLSKIGAVAVMIVLGLFVASLVNIFMASQGLSWIITYAIVLVFPILIAWRTQMLKEFVLENGHDSGMTARVAVIGALILYISFINLFMAILRILGDRR